MSETLPKCRIYLLCSLILSGCASDGKYDAMDADFIGIARSTFTTRELPAALEEAANLSTLDKQTRSRAVASLFATYVKPGFTSADMRPLMQNSQWLKESLVLNASALKIIPVIGGDRISPFDIRVLSNDESYPDVVICLALHARSEGPISAEEVIAFLCGDHADSKLRLEEFAISYPVACDYSDPSSRIDYFTERFTRRGVGFALPMW